MLMGSRSSPRRVAAAVVLTVVAGAAFSIFMLALPASHTQRHTHIVKRSTRHTPDARDISQHNDIKDFIPAKARMDQITGWPYGLRINEPGLCKDQDVFLLNAVTSNPTGVYHREMIRKMWGSEKIAIRLKMRTVFIVGSVPSPVTQKHLQEESDKYHDIVQFDFLETRKNLTIKSLAAINWFRAFCPNATWMLKCDVDAYVNFWALLDVLKPVNETKDAACARSMTRSVCRASEQHGCLPHYVVKPEEYAQHTYPPYCSGYAYVLHRRLADRMLEVDRKRTGPPLWLEDVYVTGLLPRDLNARWLDVRRRSQVVPVSIRSEFHNGSMLFIHDLEGQIGQGATSYVWTQTLNHYNVT